MKILYFVLPLWILIALPSFAENFRPQINNQFNIQKQAQYKSSKRRKDHRGSGRRYHNLIGNF